MPLIHRGAFLALGLAVGYVLSVEVGDWATGRRVSVRAEEPVSSWYDEEDGDRVPRNSSRGNVVVTAATDGAPAPGPTDGAPTPGPAAGSPEPSTRESSPASFVPLKGAAASPLLMNAEHLAKGSRLVNPELDERSRKNVERQVLDSIGRTARQRIYVHRRIEEELGEAPWNGDSFQMFGRLGEGNIAVVGADQLVPASPEATLRWVCRSRSEPVPARKRERALEVLRRFEVERRILLDRITKRILELGDSERLLPVEKGVGYAVVSGKLIVFRSGEIEELEHLRFTLRDIADRIEAEARRRIY